ncbi:MAG TPA: hypothetical protein VED01_11890 [Burkholderiales bacterium]|nr:hypothetical protein [Burkholderiales bacterium]
MKSPNAERTPKLNMAMAQPQSRTTINGADNLACIASLAYRFEVANIGAASRADNR